MNTAEAGLKVKELFGESIEKETNSLGQTTVQVKKEKLIEILSLLKNSGYEVLMDLTAVDFLEPMPHTQVLYWLHNPQNLQRIRIVVVIGRNELIPSVVSLWEGADWYERELYDMFGVHFSNHPALQRILMPDDWEGHPMRRDYALTEVPVEFKHGVKPKVPSQIIPYEKNKSRKY